MLEDDWTASGILEKDCFISPINDDNDAIDILQIFDNDDNGFSPDSIRIKMEPIDETSDYHGSSSGSPSSSLSSPNGFKDEPLGLDVNFGHSIFNAPFSPSATSSHSPTSFGMMNGGVTMQQQQQQQQNSPLPSVAHFSHNHHHHHHMVQHHSQMGMNQIFTNPTHQYVTTNVQHNFLFKDSAIYDGMDYHGSSSGSPSSSLSSPNGFKDEPLGLDVNFGHSIFNAPFSPSATSSHSPTSFGMMNGGVTMQQQQQQQQQNSPLPSVAHFSHNHHHHHHMVQHHSQMGMNQIFTNPTHQYVTTNVQHNFLFKDSAIYDGMGE
uniref:Uncharacterized protein n=1 Tax=Caenorhabditis japonica TaxID=281687 RepID=A0A8R1E1R4_CAEJA